MTVFPLRDLGVSPGQARREELELELVPYVQGGVPFAVPGGAVPARLDVVAMTEGNDFRLRFEAEYRGPCSRCLEDACFHAVVDSHEVHDPAAQEEELRSEHVDDSSHELDLTGWAQEVVGLQFPTRLLCRPDCRGLCPVCGIDLNQVEGEHAHEAPTDSRWDALRTLELDDA